MSSPKAAMRSKEEQLDAKEELSEGPLQDMRDQERRKGIPILSRVIFKILLLTYQCLHSMAPDYLSESLVKYAPSRNLRSAQKNLLQCPVITTKFYGERCFAHAAPTLWNNIPGYVKEASTVLKFKNLLKTFLFKRVF